MAGIYLHVPFCHSKCAYCDFFSIARSERAGDYAEAVKQEYRAREAELGGQPIKTLYFGGGTPSILAPEHFKSLARELLTLQTEEFTIEVNPEDVTPEKAQLWADEGVNRVSMGVQSLSDSELKAVNRRHSAAAALEACRTLQSAGITNISLDLIYGLPGQTTESFAHSIDGVIASGAKHISAYILSYEPGTLLTKRLEKGLIEAVAESTLEAMYSILCEKLTTAGFEHYEISNFALPGFRSRHNSSYWDLTPYIGLGPAAHSLDAFGVRRWHEPDLRSYLQNSLEIETEEESEEERLDDLLIISLRRCEGLDLRQIPERRRPMLEAAAKTHIAAGRLVAEEGRLYIPEEHWLIADSIIRDLLFI